MKKNYLIVLIYSISFFLKKKTNTQLFEIQKNIYNYLDNSGILNEILLSTKIYEFLTKIIGPDLEYKKK